MKKMILKFRMKNIILFSFSLLFFQIGLAQKFCSHYQSQKAQGTYAKSDTRTDTFDILHYTIGAQFIDYKTQKNIGATTSIKVLVLKPATSITLDLLGLTVHGFFVGNQPVAFTHKNSKLTAPFGFTAQAGDTLDLHIDYNGNPVADSRWGGFYFTGEYAFNLGVGFAADPHNFGRVWYPCFDNFIDRATYTFKIRVKEDKKAYCNGLLVDEINHWSSGHKTYIWEMEQPIPTYLAAVAIAPYQEVSYETSGIPVTLASLAKDTSDMKTSFEKLPECIQAFIGGYGPHSFDRIGFNMVPFNGGAMEHATNIAFPLFGIAGGTKNYETLFAHELAHHWWGNTITCRDHSQMWLNEGWASYSENLFTEAVYGKDAYDKAVSKNHREVLHYAHLRDGEALPVSGVDHARTYGMHVYNKGGDMVHSLRGVMGDDAFFEACKSFQSTYKFKDVTTDVMRDHFQGFTAKNLTSFFDNWIKTPGFCHFYVFDYSTLLNGREYKNTIRIKQDARFTDKLYKDVPYSITFFDEAKNKYETEVVLSGEDNEYEIATPIKPSFIALDFNGKLSDAITDKNQWIKQAGNIDMEDALMTIDVKDVKDSALVRVEHHWVGADAYFNNIKGLTISPQRYWTVDGIFDEKLDASATIAYNGLTPSNYADGWMDNELIKKTEDSLVLVYRPNAKSSWQIHENYTKNTGSLFNRKGVITINKLKKGQYTFGMYDVNLILGLDQNLKTTLKAFPNPATNSINFEFETPKACCYLEITNVEGKVVHKERIKRKRNSISIDVSKWSKGVYYAGIILENNAYTPVKFVVK